MSHLFGITPDVVFGWPLHRWLTYRAWVDDYQRKQREAGRRGV